MPETDITIVRSASTSWARSADIAEIVCINLSGIGQSVRESNELSKVITQHRRQRDS